MKSPSCVLRGVQPRGARRESRRSSTWPLREPLLLVACSPCKQPAPTVAMLRFLSAVLLIAIADVARAQTCADGAPRARSRPRASICPTVSPLCYESPPPLPLTQGVILCRVWCADSSFVGPYRYTCADWWVGGSDCSTTSSGYVTGCTLTQSGKGGGASGVVSTVGGGPVPYTDAYGATCEVGGMYYGGYWSAAQFNAIQAACPATCNAAPTTTCP